VARPTSDTPTASIRRRGDTFQLRWFAKPKQYELTLGHIPAKHAKTIAVVATAALAGRTDPPSGVIFAFSKDKPRRLPPPPNSLTATSGT